MICLLIKFFVITESLLHEIRHKNAIIITLLFIIKFTLLNCEKVTKLKKLSLQILFLFSFNFLFSQQWNEMINDPSINVYEIVEEAEAYFQTVDKNAKGSGWKAYNRWLYENEPKFYPSGDRSNVDRYFVSKEYLKNKYNVLYHFLEFFLDLFSIMQQA